MRIAMMTNNYKPYVGGVPISVERLALGLRELGHTVYIFAPEYPGTADDNDPFVIRYKSFSRTLGNFQVPNPFDPKIQDIFQILGVELIHVHHPVLIGQAALHLGRKYHIPVALTCHTRYDQYLHYLPPYARLQSRVASSQGFLAETGGGLLHHIEDETVPGLIRRFANQCDLVLAPSRSMEGYLRSQGVDTPVEVLPTGLPESAFSPDETRAAEIRRQFGKGKEFLLCTVSRLAEEKNLDFMLDGLVCLKEKTGGSFRMLFIGDGPLRLLLAARAEAMGLGDCVVFPGSVPNGEISSYCRACDGFLFTSRSETQGIVLLEAMAAGCPVVAVNASGTRDVVISGKNGFLTEDNPEEWAESAARLLRDEGLRNDFSQGAVRCARGYGVHRTALRAQACYEGMLRRYGYTAIPGWLQTVRQTFR